MEPLDDAIGLIQAALERLGIRYLVGGSVASSARGVWRSTLDVDLLAEIRPEQAEPLARALGEGWYADAAQIRNAILAGRPVNVIHIRTAQKIDIFPATSEFHAAELERATAIPLGTGRLLCPVATVEDILLAKLQWYRAGGEVSERQWKDIAGLLAANPSLDLEYVRSWASRLGVGDLFVKALAGGSPFLGE